MRLKLGSRNATITLDLALELPDDGTYPPRLVLPGRSVWIQDDTPLRFGGDFQIQRIDGRVTILPEDTSKEVYVNRRRLLMKTPLRDGDFVHVDELISIYQADPIADYREHADKLETTQTKVELTGRLQKHIIVNAEGMSLAGDEHFVAWSHIAFIELYREHTNNQWSIEVWQQQGEDIRKLKSKHRGSVFKPKEMLALMQWIWSVVPIELSIVAFMTRAEFPDAYNSLVWTKILDKVEAKQRIMPVSKAKLLGLPTRIAVMRFILSYLLLSFIISVIIAAIIGAALEVNLIFFILLIAFFFILVMRLLNGKALYEYIKYLFEYSQYNQLDY